MDAKQFLESATNPKKWISKSRSLRFTGDQLWDLMFRAIADYANPTRPKDKEESEKGMSRVISLMSGSQMFYGLAVETAFKGYLLKHSPDEIVLEMEADGTGEVNLVRIKEFGVPLKDGHNLLKLAHKVGVFRRGEGALFEQESDFEALQKILGYLTDSIKWGVRYPVPRGLMPM